MRQRPVMIVGLGELGGYVLEFLARMPNMPKIVTADKREDWGYRKTNSAIFGASQFGLYPEIEFLPIDIFNVEKTATLLEKIKPAVIFNGMTLQSWWVITELPEDAYRAIDEARFGPWYPMHFVPTYKLMQAVQKSGVETRVVNSAFPDLVNPALGKLGLAPAVGIGNLDNLVPCLRKVAASTFKVPFRATTVYLVAHHFVHFYISRFGTAGGAPYYLKVMVDDKDMTTKINVEEFLRNVTIIGRRPGSAHSTPLVASSVCKILMGILFDSHELGHAPGPNGLPGGYPIRLNSDKIDVFLPEELTMEDAIKINEEAQVFEGVESIEEDGTVVMTDKAAGIFKELLDYNCKVYEPKDCENKAKELDEKFRRWAARARS